MMKTFFTRTAGRTSANLLCGAAALLLAGPTALEAQVGAKYTASIVTSVGTTVAGYTGDNGAATSATLNQPTSATYDSAGNLYIADTSNNVIRRVDALTGIITTVAGNGTAGWTGDNGPATAATLNRPIQVAFDTNGNMFIADLGNCAIRQVTSAGVISTVVGEGPEATGTTANPCPTAVTGTPTVPTFSAGSAGTSTIIGAPTGVAVDSNNFVYFSNAPAYRIMRLANGVVTYYAGTASNSLNDKGDGASATLAALGQPTLLTIDKQNNLYFTDRRNDIVRVIAYNAATTGAGNINEVAGTFDGGSATVTNPTPIPGNTGDGGPATTATLSVPTGVYADPYNNVFIGDSGNSRVRVVGIVPTTTTGTINAYAGSATLGAGYAGDGGLPTAAQLGGPNSVTGLLLMGVTGTPSGGRIAIADTKNNVIRLVRIANVFGSTTVGISSSAQTILAQAALAGTISSVASANSEFVVGTTAGCGVVVAGGVCSIPVTFTPAAPGLRTSRLTTTDSTGVKAVIGLAGLGSAPAANFMAGNLADYAGTGTAGSTGDTAAATAARLSAPQSVALDAAGNAYIADTANNKIRLVTASTGVITTFAGSGTAGFGGDGGSPTAAAAQLNAPQGVAVDAAGNVYIADTGNNRVRLVSAATGLLSTVAGGASAGATGDGGPATAALLSGPTDVATDAEGSVYIADTGNSEIRKINAFYGTIATVAGTGTAGTSANGTVATAAALSAPAGVAVDFAGNIYISDTGNSLVRKVVATTGTITTVAGTTPGFAGDGAAATAAQLSVPTKLAVDPAGDVYIADTTNNRVREVNAATGFISTVAGSSATTGMTLDGTLANAGPVLAPKGVALDSTGNLYVSDTSNNRVVKIGAVSDTIAFGSLARGSTSSTQAIVLQNFGNLPMTLTGLSVTSGTPFTRLTGGSTDCTATTVLAMGATCALRFQFAPTVGGTFTATVTITDNALNKTGSTQTVTLTGTGVVVPGIITVSAGNNQTSAPLGTFATPLTVLVTDSSNFAAPGAVVTFTAPNPTGTTVGGTFAGATAPGNVTTATTDSNGKAAVTLLAGINRGTFSVTATVSGVATPATFTETIAGNVAPVVTVTVPTGAITYGQTATVTAQLTPSTVGANTTTGTVAFYDNGSTTPLTCTPTSAQTVTTSGTASCTFTPVGGVNAITATYSGDANFSTSSTVSAKSFTVTPLAITASTTNVSIPYGTVIPAIPGTLTGVQPQDVGKVSVNFAPSVTGFPDPGVYPLTPTLSGSAASNYTVTATGSPTLTIVKAGTTVVVAATPNTGTYGTTNVTLTATVASVVSGGPTPGGTVTFTVTSSSGNVTTVPNILLMNGVASTSSTTFGAGTLTITATYNGSTDYLMMTSTTGATLTLSGPDFTVGASPNTLSIAQGGRGYVNVTMTPNSIFTSKFSSAVISLSCPNMPATFSCTFLPASVTAASPTSVLTIATSGTQTLLHRPNVFGTKETTFLAIFFVPGAVLLAGLSTRKRRKSFRSMIHLGVLLLAVSSLAALAGCASGVNEPRSPLGQTTITIAGTSNFATGAVTETTTVIVTVTSPTPLQ